MESKFNKFSIALCLLLFTNIVLASTSNNNFITKILPLAREANHKVELQRVQVNNFYEQFKQHRLSSSSLKQLKLLASQYRLANLAFNNASDFERLLAKIDVIPNSLIIAQAINESAWGTSRFAQLGNNYFGQWCYQKGCGIVPKQRPSGATYEVKSYRSAQDSVDYYLFNLNANQSYQKMRELRYKMREQHQELNSSELAKGLLNYSARKAEYVKSIQVLINKYNLIQYDNIA